MVSFQPIKNFLNITNKKAAVVKIPSPTAFSLMESHEKKGYSYVPWGGSPQSDCICRAKPKTRIFANGQFSGHLIFYKKTIFFGEKIFLPL